MRVGIVGSEKIKFTPEAEQQARKIIRELITPLGTTVISGGCHLGGVDIWAVEEAKNLGRDYVVHFPKKRTWHGGYKERNQLIAEDSDIVHCIVVDVVPVNFVGMEHDECYHCHRTDHVKSGGCWTMHKAKRGFLHIVKNYDPS